MTKNQREIAREIVNNLATYSNGQAGFYRQTGYNFLDSMVDFHVSPAEFTELCDEVLS